jgi:hypothetical protein
MAHPQAKAPIPTGERVEIRAGIIRRPLYLVEIARSIRHEYLNRGILSDFYAHRTERKTLAVAHDVIKVLRGHKQGPM